MEISQITPEIWKDNLRTCKEVLEKNYDSIPLLNVNDYNNFGKEQLVKVYGMIQDMRTPEYYMEKYEIVCSSTSERMLRCGKYSDFLRCEPHETIDEDSMQNITSERRTFVVVPVPGLNNWVYNILKDRFRVTNKRPLETDQQQPACSPAHKRNRNSQSTSSTTHYNFLLDNPSTDALEYHITLYENYDTIKLNDLVEAVGFLTFGKDFNAPPQIHCISWKKVQHCNSLINDCGLKVEKEQFLGLKKELLLVFTPLLLGDAVAAQYFIYHIVSRLYSNHDLLLGKLALNITNIPTSLPDYGSQLYQFIQTLLPKSHYLPMTIANLNTPNNFTPIKNYEDDRISSGLLQLSDNTQLVLDETQLQPGTLDENGIKAMKALANVIEWQTTTYDFIYYPMDFDCNAPVLILSEGKSCLPSDLQIILKPEDSSIATFNEIVAAAKYYFNNDLLNKLRVFLTLAKFSDCTFEDDQLKQVVEDDFVRMKQDGTTSAKELNNMLVLARLVCITEGKPRLDIDGWKTAYNLEVERKRRFL